MQQVTRSGAAASASRTPLAIALLVAVVAPVRPALALEFHYVQNANGQEYFYHTTPCCLASTNWPNNNNWSQEQETFIDGAGDTIVSEPSNWTARITAGTIEPIFYYPGSPNDPGPTAEHDVFLDSFTVTGDASVTISTLTTGPGGNLNMVVGTSLTILNTLKIDSGGIVNMFAGTSLTVGGGNLPVITNISSGGILNMIGVTSLTTMGGNISNDGTINLQANSMSGANLKIADGTTLMGNGHVVLGSNPSNRIYGVTTGNEELINGRTETTFHTISGGGQLGNNFLKLTNQGLIDANLAGNALFVNPSAAGVVNQATGILRASAGGILRLQDGTFTNTGVIEAMNGSQVQLGEGATVIGGTLSSSGSGKIVVPNGTFGGFSGTITNNGLVSLESTSSSGADLKIADGTTLIGNGRVALGSNLNNRIYGVTTGNEELINGALHTISGGGQLGMNSLKLTNQGLIDGNIPAVTLYVNPSAAGATNNGIIQASGGGIVRLQDGTFTNTGGLIQALNNSQVQVGEGGTIVGGTLSSSDSGKIVVPNGTSGNFSGTITNNGLVSLESSSGTGADLKIADGTTLIGSGRVALGSNLNNRIYGVTTGNEELINGALHTISGGGQLGMNSLKLTNQGLIDGNIPAVTLYVNPSAAGATNNGIIQASGGGIVRLQDGTFTNTGGLIQALNNSQVQVGEGGTIVGGTLSSSDSGKIVVPNGTSGNFSGTITNNGLVSLESSSGTGANLIIADGMTLIGSGRVKLGSHPSNRIYGVTADSELINGEFHTISGGGELGNNSMKLTNEGTIDANILAITMHINPSASGATNTGIIQASEGGIVRLRNGTFTNTGGVIQALDLSQVQLAESGTVAGGTIVGGTLSSSGNGKIVVPNNAFGGFSGTITNNGLVSLESSSGTGANLIITDGTTLIGNGRVALGSHAGNRIYGVTTDSELINGATHTISGGGQLGNNSLKLTNQGLIDANILAITMNVDPSAAGATNTGTIQASNGATLILTGGTYTNTGTLQAIGGGTLTLTGGSTFTNTGGVIQALNGSLVQLSSMTLIGGTLSRAGTGRIVVPNGSAPTLTGPITLNAPLEINSTGSVTNLKINGNLTLSGSENVVLSNNTNNRVSGVTATDVLTLPAGRTIAGAGQVGFNLMGLVNEGTIDANLSNPLTIDPSSAGVTNTGILQASGTGGLILTGGTYTNTGTLQAIGGGTLTLTGGSTFTNTGGVIQALDGSQVQLSSMTLIGGTLSRAGTGRIVVPNGSAPTLTGPITLNAPLEINSTGSTTDLKINGNFTLSSSENVVLSNSVNNRIYGVTATDVLTLPTGRTIAGAGQIGINLMGLANQGTIDANVSNSLTVDPSSAGVTNTGTLQASNNATLSLSNGTFTNTGGVIQALNGSLVQLSNISLIGGTLSRAGTGRIVVPNSTTLTLTGPITLNAPLEINSTGSVTNLKINGNLTLSGSENVVLSNNTNNRVSGVTATDVLTLPAGRTIAGAGQVGFNLMGLVNEGTIDANLSNPLTIDPSSAGVTNTGILQASGTGGLILTGGTYTNTGGVIQALDGSMVQLNNMTLVGGTLSGAGTGQIVNQSTGILRGSGSAGLQLTDVTFDNQGIVEALNGSNVTYSSSALTSNNVTGVLTGGTWRSVATGDGATITLRGTNDITQIASGTEVVLSGIGSVLQRVTTPIESTLTTNNGTLRILDGRAFTVTNALNNDGTFELGGSGLADANLSTSTLTNSGTLLGHGTVVGNVLNSSGTVSPGSSPGTLHVTGDYSQSAEATLQIELASPLSFDKLDVTGSVMLGGVLEVSLADGFMPNVNDSFDILDWGSRTGTFSTLDLQPLAAGLVWNTLQLYTDGVLSVAAAVPGDYNNDYPVDAADYVLWRKNVGAPAGTLPNDIDGGTIGQPQYNTWRANFGEPFGAGTGDTAILLPREAVPEPSSLMLLIFAAAGTYLRLRRVA